MPQTNQLSQLRQQISQHFDEEELRELAFDLGLDYDDLGSRGKRAKARELVAQMERQGRLSDLRAAVKFGRFGSRPAVARTRRIHIGSNST